MNAHTLVAKILLNLPSNYCELVATYLNGHHSRSVDIVYWKANEKMVGQSEG